LLEDLLPLLDQLEVVADVEELVAPRANVEGGECLPDRDGGGDLTARGLQRRRVAGLIEVSGLVKRQHFVRVVTGQQREGLEIGLRIAPLGLAGGQLGLNPSQGGFDFGRPVAQQLRRVGGSLHGGSHALQAVVDGLGNAGDEAPVAGPGVAVSVQQAAGARLGPDGFIRVRQERGDDFGKHATRGPIRVQHIGRGRAKAAFQLRRPQLVGGFGIVTEPSPKHIEEPIAIQAPLGRRIDLEAAGIG